MSQAIHHHTSTEQHPNPDAEHDAGFDLTPWQSFLTAVRDAFPARFDTTNPSLSLTRVVVEAAGHLNYRATPVPVFVDIARGTHPHRHREGGIDERALLHTPSGWSGHLIALLDLGAGRHVLLDPSADRFDRPIRNLLLGGPLAAAATVPAATGLARIHPHPGDDTTVTYRAIPPTHPRHDGWRTSSWWTPDTDATRTAVRAAHHAAATVVATTATVVSLPKTHPKAG